MILQNTFPPHRIKLGLEGEFRDEVFEEMVDILVRDLRLNGYSSAKEMGLASKVTETKVSIDRDSMIEALEKREAKMSTGIKSGLAIPHATLAGLPRLVGVLGVSKKGIDYSSLDGNPVHIVFMLLSPPEDSEAHLHALKQLAFLMDNDEVIGALLQSNTPEKAFSVLRSFEEKNEYR